MPITAGREKSIKLLQDAHKQTLLAAARRRTRSRTLGKILKIINLPEGNITAIIKGVDRCKVKKILTEEPYFTTEITRLKDTEVKKDKQEFSALIDNIKDISLRIIEIDPNIPNAANFAVKNITGEVDLLNFICSNASFLPKPNRIY